MPIAISSRRRKCTGFLVAIPRRSARTARDRRPLPLLARRTRLPVPRGARRSDAEPTADVGAADLGGGGGTLPRGPARRGRRRPAARARPDREARLRALLPDRERHRALRPVEGHPLPGPGIGGQLGGLLRARDHLDRSRRATISSSSASCRRSAASHPTSTSTSSTSAARSSCNGCSTPTAATTPPSAPP